jgi:DNA-binding transcriptional MerR regulator/methylmalonyl-CoA mutase cobalamin-binding subunit
MPERTYRIHVAAELSGVRVDLIRAWERRYGVLKPERTSSGYRVYTARDVALLKRLKQLTEQGVSIGEAAGLMPRLLAELDAALPRRGEEESPSRALAWQREVLTAAEALDQGKVVAVLDEVLAALPPLRAYEEVLVPLLHEIGVRWHAGSLTVGQEHLVTQVVRARLIGLLHAAPQRGGRQALLACFPEEQHEMGLLGAALRLRHAGWSVTLLGQRVPAEEVARVATSLGAELVGLSLVTELGVSSLTESLSCILKGVPDKTVVWLGGVAAQAHRAPCEQLGARVFMGAEDWPLLLA